MPPQQGRCKPCSHCSRPGDPLLTGMRTFVCYMYHGPPLLIRSLLRDPFQQW